MLDCYKMYISYPVYQLRTGKLDTKHTSMIDKIYYWIGVCVSWALIILLALYVLALVIAFIIRLFKRTWLYYCICAVILWYNFKYRNLKFKLTPYQTEWMKQHINKTVPPFLRKYWIVRLDNHLNDLREEIKSHNEVPGF